MWSSTLHSQITDQRKLAVQKDNETTTDEKVPKQRDQDYTDPPLSGG